MYNKQDYIDINGNNVFVFHVEHRKWEKVPYSVTELCELPPLKDWLDRVRERDELIIQTIYIDSVDMFGPKKVGFLKLEATATDKEGNRVPSIIFMRGGAVVIMLLIVTKSGRRYTLLTEQMRPATGGKFIEAPAGMLDGDGNFGGVAAKELTEETSIELSQNDLVPLNEEEVWVSPGGSDETFHYFGAVIRDFPDEQLNELLEKMHGEEGTTEQIRLIAQPLVEGPMFANMKLAGRNDEKTLCAAAHFDYAVQQGKIEL